MTPKAEIRVEPLLLQLLPLPSLERKSCRGGLDQFTSRNDDSVHDTRKENHLGLIKLQFDERPRMRVIQVW